MDGYGAGNGSDAPLGLGNPSIPHIQFLRYLQQILIGPSCRSSEN
jgi:hypothetical protein